MAILFTKILNLFKSDLKITEIEINESIKHFKKSLSMIKELKEKSACPTIKNWWFDPEIKQLEILITSFNKIKEILKNSKEKEDTNQRYIYLFSNLKKEYHSGKLELFNPNHVFLHLNEKFQSIARDFLKYRTILANELLKLNEFKLKFNPDTLYLKADTKRMIEEFISLVKKINAASLIYHSDLKEIKRIEDAYDIEFQIVNKDIEQIKKTAKRMSDLREHYGLRKSSSTDVIDFDLGSDLPGGVVSRFSYEKEHAKMAKRILKYEYIIAKRVDRVLEKFRLKLFDVYPKENFEHHIMLYFLKVGNIEKFSKKLPNYLSEHKEFCKAVTENYKNYKKGNEKAYFSKKFSDGRSVSMPSSRYGGYSTSKKAYSGVMPTNGDWYAVSVADSKQTPKEYVGKLKGVMKEGYRPSNRSGTDFGVYSLFVRIKIPLRNIYYYTHPHYGYGPGVFSFDLKNHQDITCGDEDGEHYIVTNKHITKNEMELIVIDSKSHIYNYRENWYEELLEELDKQKIKYRIVKVND